jgi:hypothetical protein
MTTKTRVLLQTLHVQGHIGAFGFFEHGKYEAFCGRKWGEMLGSVPLTPHTVYMKGGYH